MKIKMMSIRTLAAGTTTAIFFIFVLDFVSAKTLPSARTNRDLKSEIFGELPDDTRQQIEDIEEQKKRCYQLKGYFYSSNTHGCERCEKHCPNGTDITLCGFECVDYYANKSLSEMREEYRISRNELETKVRNLNQRIKDNANITKNDFLNLKEHLLTQDKEISDLKKENKDLAIQVKSANQKLNGTIGVSFIVFIILAIVIVRLAYLGRKYIKKQSHSRLHGQASDDKFNPSNSKDSGIDQPEGDAESAPLTQQNRAKSRSQMTITEDNETIHQ
ncbi:uncharacterized protein LOC144422673 [Styela clava]